MAVACSNSGVFVAAARPPKLLYFNEIFPLLPMPFRVRFGALDCILCL